MIKPRTKVPNISIDLVNDTKWNLEEQDPKNFSLIVFYRGKHCPVCKKYLEELQSKLDQFTSRGVNVIAISANTEKLAKATYDEWDIADIPVGFEFPIEKAKEWGLFASKGIKEEPDMFFEPGLFLIRPDGELYCSSVQTMPFARPDFDDLLKAIDFILDKDYPARGEA
ncbi:peroxiredoxin-like family protein [Sediminibacter sp. Hel_I_10]|uniref:peroxiredoxin-like family protein n=1 Tax=Sediminibacter sp. Hel_I_10 TaxID=1392490 RepID=UPI00047CE757|nr:peroxiredoxin-like family protein [Sediminibacter sp. Hel_I_10]